MAGSIGIRSRNNGAIICQFRIRTHGTETDLGGRKAVADFSTCSYDELIRASFKAGDVCWVSVDIIATVTNHESGSQKDAPFTLVYTLFGGTAIPSSTGP
ncbi:unnamed protein product [Clonostachys chloroleuca]|uniref:Uncharacterized protein n=1 Tax=Clonostachys chloroleuca TaxID=1926264 RepID=A0AA35MFN4_9HYPO|nr:unnamed protein product [Clonostachys chloroleuca]